MRSSLCSTATSTAAGRCSTAPTTRRRSKASSSRRATTSTTKAAMPRPPSPRATPTRSSSCTSSPVGSLPHQGGDAARRAGQRPARRERAAAARRGARLRHEAHLRRRLLRAARHHGADLFGESQLLLLLPAQLHVLALFPVELRRPPERHPTHRFDDDHRRQLAVGNRRDRPHLPGAAGESAARSG